ncbi:GT-D fold domain-containing protein [Roseicyclus sp.]
MTPDRLAEIVGGARFDDDAVLGLFLDRVKSRQPTSLIRLGDGEGKLLGHVERGDTAMVRNQLRIWFGDRDFAEEDIHTLRTGLLEAIETASFLGLPKTGRTFATDADGNPTTDAVFCQAIWRVLQTGGILDRHDVLGSAMIHRHAQIGRWFATLLGLGRPMVFVTRTRIAVNRLVGNFGIRDYSVHLIPGETWSREDPVSDHFPTRFHEVRAALARIAPGSIGLVGAGVLGKIYCSDIADAGGAAFDCGALFDAWASDIPKQRRANMPDPSKLTVAWLRGDAPAPLTPGSPASPPRRPRRSAP